MTKTKFTIHNLKSKAGGVSKKTGEPWFFWEWQDERSEWWSIPSFAISFTPEEGKEYEVEYELIKNGTYTNRRITSIGSIRQKETPSETPNPANKDETMDKLRFLHGEMGKLLNQ